MEFRLLGLIFGVLLVLLCGKFILQAKVVCIALLELGLLWLEVQISHVRYLLIC
jgi:hypothetical protein